MKNLNLKSKSNGAYKIHLLHEKQKYIDNYLAKSVNDTKNYWRYILRDNGFFEKEFKL